MTTKCVDSTTPMPVRCSKLLTIRLIVDYYNNRVIKTLRAVYS